jgi:hypothetical protein
MGPSVPRLLPRRPDPQDSVHITILRDGSETVKTMRLPRGMTLSAVRESPRGGACGKCVGITPARTGNSNDDDDDDDDDDVDQILFPFSSGFFDLR